MKQFILLLCLATCYATDQSTQSNSSIRKGLFNITLLGDIITEIMSQQQEGQSRSDDYFNGARIALTAVQLLSEDANGRALALYYATLIGHAAYRYYTNKGVFHRTHVTELFRKNQLNNTQTKQKPAAIQPVQQEPQQAVVRLSPPTNESNNNTPQEPEQKEIPAPTPCNAQRESIGEEVTNPAT